MAGELVWKGEALILAFMVENKYICMVLMLWLVS